MKALMDRAAMKAQPEEAAPDAMGAPEAPPMEGGGEKFTKPDISGFIPEQMQDAVARIVAAGTKLIYSPQLREQVMKDIEREGEVPQKLAESTVGLLLTLDGQAKGGGIPMEALFPAGMELLGEAAEILSATGQVVTQADYNQAALQMSMLIVKKLAPEASDEEIMQVHEQMMGGQQAPAQQLPPGPPGAAPGAAPDDGWEE
jgi:hypothetical protein